MLAMSTVLRREPPFRTILRLRHAVRRGRPADAQELGQRDRVQRGAERMGVDVMRWMFAKARPEDNILFGYNTADEARRELLILWNVYAFFVTYARWRLAAAGARHGRAGAATGEWPVLIAGSCRAPPAGRRCGARWPTTTRAAPARRLGTFIDDLSTWYLRAAAALARRRRGRSSNAAFACCTRRWSAWRARWRRSCPSWPRRCTRTWSWPGRRRIRQRSPHRAGRRRCWRATATSGTRAAMAVVRRAVELTRTLRGQAGLRLRQPLRRMWLALPAADGPIGERRCWSCCARRSTSSRSRSSATSRSWSSGASSRCCRSSGRAWAPTSRKVMAAARANEVEYLADGGVRLAGIELAADEVEILATPRPGTAVAHDEGLVVVIDTELDDSLRAEGDARELTRAVQDLRKQAGLELDEQIDLWLDAPAPILGALEPFLGRLAEDTLAATLGHDAPPTDARRASQEAAAGPSRSTSHRAVTAGHEHGGRTAALARLCRTGRNRRRRRSADQGLGRRQPCARASAGRDRR
jgi:isoleucyl-tRNA synthetase